MRLSAGSREGNLERRPLLRRTGHSHSRAVPLSDPAGEREPEPKSVIAALTRISAPIKTLKDKRQFGMRDADPLILNPQIHFLPPKFRHEINGSAVAGIFDCVIAQNKDQAPDRRAIAPNRRAHRMIGNS